MEDINRFVEVQSVVAFNPWVLNFHGDQLGKYKPVLNERAAMAWGSLRRFIEYHLRQTPLYEAVPPSPRIDGVEPEPLSRKEALGFAKLIEEVIVD
jgi:hypothetical protein